MVMSPPAETTADLPIYALTSLSMTSTMIETATPALPSLRASAPDTLMILVSSSALTSIVCAGFTANVAAWLIRAPSAMLAWVVNDRTSTITEPVTAALPPPALPPTAIDVTAGRWTLSLSGSGSSGETGFSVAFDLTDKAFATSMQVVPALQVAAPLVSESIYATVVTDRMFTATAPPTALPLVERAPEIGRFSRPMKLVALTSRLSVEVTFAPFPITAVVVKERTWIAADAATLASDLPPATANAQTTKSFSLPAGVTASTVTGPPVTCAPAPIATSDWRLVLRPMALALALTWFSLLILTAPGALTVSVVSWPISAVVEIRAQFSETAAAMLTPPLSSPDSLLDLLFALSVFSLPLGRSPSVFPVVFGFLPTWSFDWSSELLPSSFSPLELACALASLEPSVEALTASDAAVRLRSRSAVVVVSTTLIDTAAPIATSLPPAEPFESALALVSSLAWIVASPVTVSAAPVPRYAVTWSLTMFSESEGLIATPPSEPALSSVPTSWWKAAEMVRFLPPVKCARSSIAARTTLSVKTWIAAEAPMPTLPLLASESALAPSSSLLCALSVTAPPVAVMVAPACRCRP